MKPLRVDAMSDIVGLLQETAPVAQSPGLLCFAYIKNAALATRPASLCSAGERKDSMRACSEAHWRPPQWR
jgi:hypothetical protein